MGFTSQFSARRWLGLTLGKGSGDVPGSGSRAACQAVIEVLEGCEVMALPFLPRAPPTFWTRPPECHQ